MTNAIRTSAVSFFSLCACMNASADTATSPSIQNAAIPTNGIEVPIQSSLPESRSTSNNFYYKRPKGVMYVCWNKDNKSTVGVNTMLMAPAFVDLPLVPMRDTDTPLTWVSIWGDDYTDNQDSDGTCWLHCAYTGVMMNMPWMSDGTNKYLLGEGNPTSASSPYPNSNLLYYNGYYTLGYTNDHDGQYQHIPGVSNIFDTGYFFGSGKSTSNPEAKGYGVRQTFEKPLRALSVDDIFTSIVTRNSSNPIPEGTELTMKLVGLESGTTIATLTASDKDVKMDVKNSTNPFQVTTGDKDYGTWYAGKLTFTKKNGEGDKEQFVINEAFYAQIEGLDQDGVDVGFFGDINNPEDPLEPALAIIKNPDNTFTGISYENKVSLTLVFTSRFDNVVVDPDNSAITISADGEQTSVEGIEVYTQNEWFTNRTGAENYEVVYSGDASWLSYEVDNEKFYEGTAPYTLFTGLNVFKFKATPLPDGVDSRTVEMRFKGNGIVNDTPIVITQDRHSASVISIGTDATEETDTPVYSITGVRVHEPLAPGLYIKKGQKFIVK